MSNQNRFNIVENVEVADSSFVKNTVTNVRKSENDSRLYKIITLENNLRILLISDKETDKASACLSVNIGSMSDPEDLPGLAHFCEHMLFLGTTKYPVENTYHKFISEHGGQCNAVTKPDETSFVFDISPEYLSQALDIFSGFFLSPLFTESATEREVNAIQAEHEKNLCSDTRRLFQLERSLSLSGHDYSKFFTGNRHSLLESSCAKVTKVRQRLLSFHSHWYSANIMSLVILGKERLDKLEEMAIANFHAVIDRKVVRPCWPETPWPESCLKKKVFVVPLNDIYQLHILWPVPDHIPHYHSQPHAYVIHLLGHEGRGSLLSLLKRYGWVNHLSCGVGRPAECIAHLILSFDLTERGLDHVDDVILKVYQYISMINEYNPQKWIYQEQQAISALDFRFKDKERPYEYTMELAGNILRYELIDVLSGPYLSKRFDPHLIQEIIDCLTPQNSRVFVVSRKFDLECGDVEQWYGTHYNCVDIPDELIQMWQYPDSCPQFHLPEPNEYIATSFDLVPKPLEPYPELPGLLLQTDFIRFWFYQDVEFELPKAYITFHITSPLTFQDPLQTLLAALYVDLFADHISEDSYACMLAGLNVDVRRTTQGVKLSFSGLTDKLKLLIDKTLTELVNFKTPLLDRFDCLRDDMSREISNFNLKAPYQQAGVYLTDVLSDRSWINDEFEEAFQEVTYDRLIQFIPIFFSRIFIEALVYGNVTPAETLVYRDKIEALFVENMNSKGLLPSQLTMAREAVLPNASSYLFRRLTTKHPTSAINYYLQCGEQSTLDDTILNLFCQVVSEPIFNVLRTEKQLGYIVHAGARRSNTMQGFRVVVQSSEHPNKIEKHIEEFLNNAERLLQKMTDDEFQVHVESLLTHLREKPKGMGEKYLRLWSEVACRHYNFDRYKHEAKILEKITKSQLIDFYKKNISPKSGSLKKLVIHVISQETHGNNLDSMTPVGKNIVLKDYAYLKHHCPLSPLAKPFIDLVPQLTTTRSILSSICSDDN